MIRGTVYKLRQQLVRRLISPVSGCKRAYRQIPLRLAHIDAGACDVMACTGLHLALADIAADVVVVLVVARANSES